MSDRLILTLSLMIRMKRWAIFHLNVPALVTRIAANTALASVSVTGPLLTVLGSALLHETR
jgi:hypothetical protein